VTLEGVRSYRRLSLRVPENAEKNEIESGGAVAGRERAGGLPVVFRIWSEKADRRMEMGQKKKIESDDCLGIKKGGVG